VALLSVGILAKKGANISSQPISSQVLEMDQLEVLQLHLEKLGVF